MEFFMGASWKPEVYNSHVANFVAMAPAYYRDVIYSEIQRGNFNGTRKVVDDYSPGLTLWQRIGLLAGTTVSHDFRLKMLAVSETQVDDNLDLEAVGHCFAWATDSASGKNIRYLQQIYKKGGLYRYDYGTKENKRRYGQEKPPKAELSALKMPVIILHGKYDALTTTPDNMRLKDDLQKLGVLKGFYEYPFGHGGFMISKDMPHIKDMLDFLYTK